MRAVLRTGVAIAAAFLMAQGAIASDCESEGDCGNPGGGGPPSLPSLPSLAVGQSASYFAYPSDGWNSNVVQGTSYYNSNAGQFYLSTFGGGVGVPFDSAVHTYGSGNSVVTLQSYFSPDPTIAVTAHQDLYHGRADVGVSMGYLVTLATPDAATADAIQALMGSNPFATMQGNYHLSGSGYGESYVGAYSGFGPGDSSYRMSAQCDDGTNGSFGDHSGGCGAGAFNINLGFVRGDQFADGNANYFYAVMNLSAEADAGIGNLGIWPGDAAAFIDPTITLSGLLAPYGNRLTLDVGGFGPPQAPSAAPEPASWALMLGGFGLIGATMRSRRTQVRFV
jgi:hypothetical protein